MFPSRVLERLAALIILVPTLAGCASMKVYSYVERNLDLTPYRTYDWAPMESRSVGDPRLDNNPFFDERVRAAVEQELATKGFEKATSAAPDVRLHYHASVSQDIDIRGLNREYGYCEDADCGPYVYEAGTLLVDLVDARTNKLLWRGWAEGSMDGAIDDQKWMEERIDQAVKRILERLPRKL
jgi:hypothetical protein